MFARNRQSQGYPNAQTQNPGNQAAFQSQNSYSQQGNYQRSQPTTTNQQVVYKQGNMQNSQPFKSQEQVQMQRPTGIRAIQMKSQLIEQQQSQQQQLQQSQQQHMQQQQQHIQQSLSQQPSSNTPQPQRLKPILKSSSITASPVPVQNTSATPQQPASTSQSISPLAPDTPASSNNTNDANVEGKSESADTDAPELPRWRRKIPGFKVNKKLKRLRLNQRLRKTLQPKNAIMVLNEMKAGVQFTFPETQGHMSNSLYLVHAELDGKTYVGQGLSKPLARQNAAENALKALLLEKMTAASLKARMDAESDGQASQSTDSSMSSLKEENTEDEQMQVDTNTDESEEVPWSSLASFALYKLFLEWHNQGTSVPVPRPGLPTPVKGSKKILSSASKLPVQKELPPNATNIHPVMLLNQMKSGLTYVEISRVGNPPNTMFTLAVEIDGVGYTGTAKNKKDAKKIAAKAALLALYGLTYPEENKMDTSEDV